MDSRSLLVSGGALFLAALFACSAEAQSSSRCVALKNGIEYRAYLPDGNRYVYVSVKALSGVHPSVFVMIDKNYETSAVKPVKDDPNAGWWVDRSIPMRFSTDTVKIRWQDSGAWHAVTSWVSDPDWIEVTQAVRGLSPEGKGFVGTGAADSNTFAFQTRVEMQDFRGDAFDVTLPSVTFEGVTVAPPVVHFERDDNEAVSAKC